MGSSYSVPAQPSPQSEASAWAQSLPTIYAAQEQYAPQEAAQQYQLYSQYAPQMAQEQQQIQNQLYPQTSALQENVASLANQGINSNMPDWMRQQNQSNINASLGSNVMSPIGQGYASRALMQQGQDWKNYYANMGLSAAGRQPLAQPTMPQYSNYMSGYTPGGVMNNMAQTYNTAGGIYGSQLQYGNPLMSLLGGIGGSVAGGAAGGMTGYGGIFGQALPAAAAV